MIRLHASWILPIADRPIRDGWVAIDDDRVVAVGQRRPSDGRAEQDLGRVAVLPGLVNAHTHLELSYLRGAVPAASCFVDWVRAVIAARRIHPALRAPQILDALQRAIDEALRAGTALVGDISNTLASAEPLARSRLAAFVFYELIGFTPADPEGLVQRARRELDELPKAPTVRTGLAAHAPYSVAPELFHAIRRAVDGDPTTVCSVHLAESPEETEFTRTAGGPCRSLLLDLRVWNPAWVPPGTGSIQYLDDAGFLDRRVLAVHCVQATRADLARLNRRGTTIVTCPRSNLYTGAGRPPIERFYEAGARVAVGTDSLASSPDLNVFAELAAMRALAPSVPAALLLESATHQGARALGFDGAFGTIRPGARARLIAVEIPAGLDDVEEYLVSGIHPDQIRWIG